MLLSTLKEYSGTGTSCDKSSTGSMKKKLIIAIDGYSSCGKSTFAKAIAKELGYIYIDSGAMYRAVTLFCMEQGYIINGGVDMDGIISELQNIQIEFRYNSTTQGYKTFLNNRDVEEEIRGIEVSSNVSRISQIEEVRTRMVEIQRNIGRFKGIVMDGRDIGTVVFPDADIKIFMTASLDVRAQRRFDELMNKGLRVDFGEVKNNIIARDLSDENRDISPLRRADDAIVLDNTRMSIPEQMKWIMNLTDSKINESRD